MASGSNQGSLRQRNVPGKSTSPAPPSAQIDDVALDKLAAANAKPVVSENNFRIAFAVITALAFVTRFWGISHPNEVVFDEVHFGKVRATMQRLTSSAFPPAVVRREGS